MPPNRNGVLIGWRVVPSNKEGTKVMKVPRPKDGNLIIAVNGKDYCHIQPELQKQCYFMRSQPVDGMAT